MQPRLRQLAYWLGPPLAFLLLASIWIDVPGLSPDETLPAQVLFPDPPGGPAWKMRLFGWDVPVMLMPYLGGLKAWLYKPIIAVLGTGPGALRLPMIAVGALTIFVFARLARHWAGPVAGTFTAWLVATDPTFLWTTRCDWGPVALQRFFSVAGCGLIWLWRRDGGAWRLFLGFFLFGLGLFDKLTFHWLVIAYAVAVLVLVPRRTLAAVKPASAALALAGFTLGAAPYFAYRWETLPQGPDLILETEPVRYQQKWWMFERTLQGTFPRGFMIASSAPAPAPSRGWLDDALDEAFGPDLREGSAESLLPWAVAAAVFLLPWTRDPAARFAAVFWAAGLAAMAPLRDAGSIHHQALLLPYPQLLVGTTLAFWASRGARPRGVAWAALAVVLASNLITLASLYRDVVRLGGAGHWNEAVYGLADELRSRHPRFAVSLDWGTENPQRWLLAHEPPVQPLAFSWDWADRGTVERLEQEIRQGGVLFVGRANEAERLYPESWTKAREAVAEAGFRLDLAGEVFDRNGRAVFQILEPRPLGEQNR